MAAGTASSGQAGDRVVPGTPRGLRCPGATRAGEPSRTQNLQGRGSARSLQHRAGRRSLRGHGVRGRGRPHPGPPGSPQGSEHAPRCPRFQGLVSVPKTGGGAPRGPGGPEARRPAAAPERTEPAERGRRAAGCTTCAHVSAGHSDPGWGGGDCPPHGRPRGSHAGGGPRRRPGLCGRLFSGSRSTIRSRGRACHARTRLTGRGGETQRLQGTHHTVWKWARLGDPRLQIGEETRLAGAASRGQVPGARDRGTKNCGRCSSAAQLRGRGRSSGPGSNSPRPGPRGGRSALPPGPGGQAPAAAAASPGLRRPPGPGGGGRGAGAGGGEGAPRPGRPGCLLLKATALHTVCSI
ncbi:uncharacterized protein [Vulpes vulpes]|uniref:Collagen alpha-1(I) chain-like n=1 Tax=Vulpes vulpes TaxID=9627 RepID=A0ABM4XKN5_VULVU